MLLHQRGQLRAKFVRPAHAWMTHRFERFHTKVFQRALGDATDRHDGCIPKVIDDELEHRDTRGQLFSAGRTV